MFAVHAEGPGLHVVVILGFFLFFFCWFFFSTSRCLGKQNEASTQKLLWAVPHSNEVATAGCSTCLICQVFFPFFTPDVQCDKTPKGFVSPLGIELGSLCKTWSLFCWKFELRRWNSEVEGTDFHLRKSEKSPAPRLCT